MKDRNLSIDELARETQVWANYVASLREEFEEAERELCRRVDAIRGESLRSGSWGDL